MSKSTVDVKVDAKLARVLQAQYKKYFDSPHENLIAWMDEESINVWYFLVVGLEAPFECGEYIFKLTAPAEFPQRPPSFEFITPNGVFQPGGPICISIGEFHANDAPGKTGGNGWRPALGMAGFAVNVINAMTAPPDESLGGGIRIISTKDPLKKTFARNSPTANRAYPRIMQAMEDILAANPDLAPCKALAASRRKLQGSAPAPAKSSPIAPPVKASAVSPLAVYEDPELAGMLVDPNDIEAAELEEALQAVAVYEAEVEARVAVAEAAATAVAVRAKPAAAARGVAGARTKTAVAAPAAPVARSVHQRSGGGLSIATNAAIATALAKVSVATVASPMAKAAASRVAHEKSNTINAVRAKAGGAAAARAAEAQAAADAKAAAKLEAANAQAAADAARAKAASDARALTAAAKSKAAAEAKAITDAKARAAVEARVAAEMEDARIKAARTAEAEATKARAAAVEEARVIAAALEVTKARATASVDAKAAVDAARAEAARVRAEAAAARLEKAAAVPEPVIAAPKPVVVAPKPVVVAPKPVVVAPKPVVVAPKKAVAKKVAVAAPVTKKTSAVPQPLEDSLMKEFHSLASADSVELTPTEPLSRSKIPDNVGLSPVEQTKIDEDMDDLINSLLDD